MGQNLGILGILGDSGRSGEFGRARLSGLARPGETWGFADLGESGAGEIWEFLEI